MIQKYGDKSKGFLNFLPFKQLGFIPKRMFYVTDVPQGSTRGGHGHYKDNQYLICIKGEIEVELLSAESHRSMKLEAGDHCLMHNMVWSRQKYLTGDDILLVLCSEEYDQEDYFYTKSEVHKR